LLLETFDSDRDIHSETARLVFGPADELFPEEMRRRAKIINFSIIYGTSAFPWPKNWKPPPQRPRNSSTVILANTQKSKSIWTGW